MLQARLTECARSVGRLIKEAVRFVLDVLRTTFFVARFVVFLAMAISIAWDGVIVVRDFSWFVSTMFTPVVSKADVDR